MNIFLDDIRNPDWVTLYKTDPYKEMKWVVVRSYNEFVNYVKENGMPIFVSLDHDLSDEHYSVYEDALNGNIDIRNQSFKEKNGYDALKWLCSYALDNKEKLPEIKFHTANYIGWKNMMTYYNNFLKHHPQLK
jgi:hypothetical protein